MSGLTVLALALCAGELTTLGAAAAVAARSRSDGAPASGERPAAAGDRLTLRAALPFAANGVLATAYNRFDIVLLAALASADQLSLYAPATRIQDALYFIPSALGAIALPIFARGAQRAEEAVPLAPTLARFIVLGLLAGLPLAVGLTLTAGAVLPLVLGPEYVGAAPATRIMVWSLPVSVIGAPLLAALAARGHAAATTQAFAVAFMVAIALHLALDPVWGATGAAVAGVLRDGANLLTGAWLAHRVGLFTSRPAPAYAPAVARSDVRG
ncbi:MAG: oligosaccharide flippase family protein [Dehalococcoidia bacterium]